MCGGGLVAKLCLTLATPWTVACQAPLSMGILQARILEWVAISFSINNVYMHIYNICYIPVVMSSILYEMFKFICLFHSVSVSYKQ